MSAMQEIKVEWKDASGFVFKEGLSKGAQLD